MPISHRSPYLYRIVDFKHVVDLFQTHELHFSSPRNWPDPYEQIFGHRRSNAMFAQCWSTRAASDAMWRIYSPNQMAVRLRTNRDALSSALAASTVPRNVNIFVKGVRYLPAGTFGQRIKEISPSLEQRFELKKAAGLLFLKREAFDYEKEVRVVLHDKKLADHTVASSSLRIKVDPHALIDSIQFDPRATPTMDRVFRHYLREGLKYVGNIDKSLLDRVDAFALA